MKYIYCLLSFVLYSLLEKDIEKIAVIFFIILIVNIVINYKKYGKISYLDVWNLGFIFIVISETILISSYLNNHSYGLLTVRYIFCANVMVNLGFNLVSKFNMLDKVNSKQINRQNSKIFIGRFMMNFLLILSFVYFVTFIGSALESFRSGRVSLLSLTEGSSSNVVRNLISGISISAPIIAIFYFRFFLNYKYKKIAFFLIIILCIIPQFLWGTRYNLLFSLIAPLIVFFNDKRLSFRTFSSLTIIFIIIIASSNFMKLNRDNIDLSPNENLDLVNKIASLGSNEGVVKGFLDILDYSKQNGYSYGKESAFMLYFYIPRSYWPAKPTQLSSWLVREYNNVSDTHSAAYGFWGEIFMDFGYFSLLVLFLLGVFLKKLNFLKDINLKKESYISILYIALFPVLFLGIRSPQTSLINFIVIVIIYTALNYVNKKFNPVKI